MSMLCHASKPPTAHASMFLSLLGCFLAPSVTAQAAGHVGYPWGHWQVGQAGRQAGTQAGMRADHNNTRA